jgi:peptidoglycan/LPS O-acetylase OafA/YrhL
VNGAGRERRTALDGIRALAVLAVIGFHAWPRAFPGGAVGVDAFFVLSGFLITTLLLDEHARGGGISLSRFYQRRALRLLPPLAVVLVVVSLAAALLLSDGGPTITGVVAAVTYSSDWVVALHGSGSLGLLGPTWSLAVEEQFYLLWPLLLMLLLRVGGRRAVLGFALAGVVGVAALRGVALSHGASFDRVYYAPDMRADSLLLGCGLAVLCASRLPVVVARALAWRRGAATLAGVAGMGCLAAMVFLPRFPVEPAPYGLTIAAVASALLIIGALSRSRLAALLGAAPLARIGTLSYAMYLWHVPVMAVWEHGFGVGPGLPRWVLVVVCTTGVSAASWVLVERRMAALRRRLGGDPGRARAAAAA